MIDELRRRWCNLKYRSRDNNLHERTLMQISGYRAVQSWLVLLAVIFAIAIGLTEKAEFMNSLVYTSGTRTYSWMRITLWTSIFFILVLTIIKS